MFFQHVFFIQPLQVPGWSMHLVLLSGESAARALGAVNRKMAWQLLRDSQ